MRPQTARNNAQQLQPTSSLQQQRPITPASVAPNSTLKRPATPVSANNTTPALPPATAKRPGTGSISQRPSTASATRAPQKSAVPTLWDALKGKQHTVAQQNQSHVLFLGMKKSGKSSLLKKYLLKSLATQQQQGSDLVKPTVALEYTYGKREVANTANQIHSTVWLTHFWELAEGDRLLELLDEIVTAETVPWFVFVIVVDVSGNVCNMVQEAQLYLSRIHDLCNKCLQQSTSKHTPSLMNKLFAKQQDNLAPVPILLVANKMDTLLQQAADDPQRIKHTLGALRSLCYSYGASIMTHDAQVQDKMSRIWLQQFVTLPSVSVNALPVWVQPLVQTMSLQDYLQPVRILAHKESKDDVWKWNPTAATAHHLAPSMNGTAAWEPLKLVLLPQLQLLYAGGKQFQPLSTVTATQARISEHAEYKEAQIDTVKNQKDEEIANLRRQKNKMVQL